MEKDSAILPSWGLKLLISYFKPLPKTPATLSPGSSWVHSIIWTPIWCKVVTSYSYIHVYKILIISPGYAN